MEADGTPAAAGILTLTGIFLSIARTGIVIHPSRSRVKQIIRRVPLYLRTGPAWSRTQCGLGVGAES